MTGRGSPTNSEYDYIKRLVDDGEPVKLTKKVRKALKLKDETEQLDKAMKEDLKAAGYNNKEINDEQANKGYISSDDSADERKRNAIKTEAKLKGHHHAS